MAEKIRLKTETGFIDLEKFIDGLLDSVRGEIEKSIKPLRERGKYCGVYQKALDYKKGNFCTSAGSLWACTKDTQSKPGEDADWQLAAKGGH